MHRSLADSNWVLLHRMAHSLKSSSATFGAMRLSEASAELEHLAKAECSSADCFGVLAVLAAEHESACDALRSERLRFAGA